MLVTKILATNQRSVPSCLGHVHIFHERPAPLRADLYGPIYLRSNMDRRCGYPWLGTILKIRHVIKIILRRLQRGKQSLRE